MGMAGVNVPIPVPLAGAEMVGSSRPLGAISRVKWGLSY
jgi:hypothetical protein